MKGNRVLWMLMGGLLLAPPVWAGPYAASNGAVTDQRTGLVWQQQDDGQVRTWEAAIAYCEGLTLTNQSDWRLPNVKELESITDDDRWSPAIDPIFTGTSASFYWSSTTYALYPDFAWVVYFYNGYVYYSHKSLGYYVRCVRGGQ
ncbi:MAG: DUF1566 domain-containing protein [Desulfoarculaceae bacterium]|nr:DUF1566 domain-containing protein [Desulfoarculaceae bacterium]